MSDGFAIFARSEQCCLQAPLLTGDMPGNQTELDLDRLFILGAEPLDILDTVNPQYVQSAGQVCVDTANFR